MSRLTKAKKNRTKTKLTTLRKPEPLPAAWSAAPLLSLRTKRVTRTSMTRYIEEFVAAHAPLMLGTAFEGLLKGMRRGDRESMVRVAEIYRLLSNKSGPVVNIEQQIGSIEPRSFEATILRGSVERQGPAVIEATSETSVPAGNPA